MERRRTVGMVRQDRRRLIWGSVQQTNGDLQMRLTGRVRVKRLESGCCTLLHRWRAGPLAQHLR